MTLEIGALIRNLFDKRVCEVG